MNNEIIEYLEKNLNYQNKKYEKNKIIIFGDSHAKCFCRTNIQINNFTIINKFKSGATLKGLSKEESTLNYKKYIYDNIDNDSIIIFKFGQVDMEYGFYYTNIIKKMIINIDDYIKQLIEIYKIFLINLMEEIEINRKNINIIVFSINLCNPIKKWKKKIYNTITNPPECCILDKLTYNDHNINLIKFNNLLKNLCKELNIKFIDATNMICIKKKNIYNIKKEYIGNDNHLKGAETKKFINYNDKLYGVHTYFSFLKLIMDNI